MGMVIDYLIAFNNDELENQDKKRYATQDEIDSF